MTITAGPNHLLAARRGSPHGFRYAGDAEVRGLCLYTPAGHENYFGTCMPQCPPAPEEIERFKPVAPLDEEQDATSA